MGGKQLTNRTRPLVHRVIFGVLFDSDQTQGENPAFSQTMHSLITFILENKELLTREAYSQ